MSASDVTPIGARDTSRDAARHVVRDVVVDADRPATSRRLRLAVAGSLVAKAIEIATLVLLATLVPRVLGPSDFGRFSVLLTIVTLGSLALTLGGPTLMTRFVPAAPHDERVALARAIGVRLARGRAAQLAGLAVVGGILVAADSADFPPLATALVFVALALNVATSLALQMALGLGRTGPWSARFPLQNAVLIVATLVLYPAAGITGATVAIVLSALAGAVLAAVTVTPAVGGDHPRVPVPPGAIRFGAMQAGAAALVQCSQRGGVLAVAVLAGSTVETGYAALAIGIALGATYAILQTFTVSLPHLDHGDAAGATHAGEATLRRLALILVVAVLPVATAVAPVLDDLVPMLFGDDFRGASDAFAPALALVLLAPLSALLVQVSALRLRPDAALAAGIAAAAGFVVVALVGVPAWDATGGTAAALAGGAAGALVGVRLLRRAAGLVLGVASFGGAALVLVLALAT